MNEARDGETPSGTAGSGPSRRRRPAPKPLPPGVVEFLRRRSQLRHRRGLRVPPAVKILAVAAGAILVYALAADLLRTSRDLGAIPRIPSDHDPAAWTLEQGSRLYEDPEGRFRIRVPGAWAVYSGPAARPYQVKFLGPSGMEIAVLVTPVGTEPFDLLERIRALEAEWGVPANIRIASVRGRAVVERTMRLAKKTVRALDFLETGRAHHLQAAAPRDRFEELAPFLAEVLDTYEPGPLAP